MESKIQLWEEYEPQTFDELLGQASAVDQIKRCLQYGFGGALFFIGASGVGKTSAAKVIARTMNMDVLNVFSGFREVEGGVADIQSLRNEFNTLAMMSDSGFRLLVINQSDKMYAKERNAWLGWLERIPQHAMVIFTSKTRTLSDEGENGVDQLESRGTVIEFESRRNILLPYAQNLIQRVWLDKGGIGPVPTVMELERGQKNRQLSFRQLLNQLRSRLPLPREEDLANVQSDKTSASADVEKCYPSERLAYLAKEAAKMLIGKEITHRQAYEYIRTNTEAIGAMHPELVDYKITMKFDPWAKAVAKGSRAYHSRPPEFNMNINSSL